MLALLREFHKRAHIAKFMIERANENKSLTLCSILSLPYARRTEKNIKTAPAHFAVPNLAYAPTCNGIRKVNGSKSDQCVSFNRRQCGCPTSA